jgi:hypothetical protein
MTRTIRPVGFGLALLAASGCAAAPAPHPIFAQATPAGSAAGSDAAQAQAQASPAPAASPPAAQGAPASSGAATASSTDDEARERRSRRSARDLAWVSLGIGATAAVVAGVTGVMMLHYQGQRSSDCDGNKVCSTDGLNANTQLSQIGPWNAAAFGVAAVGLGLGAYLMLTNKADDGAHTALGVTPGGVRLEGSF